MNQFNQFNNTNQIKSNVSANDIYSKVYLPSLQTHDNSNLYKTLKNKISYNAKGTFENNGNRIIERW